MHILRRTMAICVLALASVMGSASEIDISMTPIGPTIGPDADYAAISGTIKIDDVSRMLNATLTFNYGASSLNTVFTDRGVNLHPGDLLFYVGTLQFGIPIADHENLPGNANGVTLHAGYLYENQQYLGQTKAPFQTAHDILNLNPISWPYRPNNAVWLGNAPTHIGTLAETSSSQAITINGVKGYQYTVTLTGTLPQAFVTDVDAATMNQTFSAYFAAATCANGVLTGSPPPPQVPEPSPILLLAIAGPVIAAARVWRNCFHAASVGQDRRGK